RAPDRGGSEGEALGRPPAESLSGLPAFHRQEDDHMSIDFDKIPQGATLVEGMEVGRTEGPTKLKLPKSPDFYLVHHGGYHLHKVKDGYELLPTLKPLFIQAGVNGVAYNERDGRPNSSHARTLLADAGRTVLGDQSSYRIA